jgi:hypothetical protein
LKNLLINGGCQVAQRLSTALSTTPTYGQVDRYACWGSGTAVSAGSITQDIAAPIGRTAYALKLAGVTITGAGVVYARQRIESINAKRLKNQVASFSVQVHHDVGFPINYVVTIRKANATDNFTSTTVVGTSAATSVADATGTQLTLPNVAMGDCSSGIEIEVQAQCGAVTAKNFRFTEWQLEEGASVSPFERRDASIDLLLAKRYFQVLTQGDELHGWNNQGGSQVWFFWLPVEMRAVPTKVVSGTAWRHICSQTSGGGFTIPNGSEGNSDASSTKMITLAMANGSGFTAVSPSSLRLEASGRIELSAEL